MCVRLNYREGGVRRQIQCENNRGSAQFIIVDKPYKNMLNPWNGKAGLWRRKELAAFCLIDSDSAPWKDLY